MTLETTPQTSETKPLPAWASIAVILLCLVGGGWMVHWYINTGDLVKQSSIISENPGSAAANPAPKRSAAARRAPPPVPEQPAVRQQDQNSWWVHAPEAAMEISQPAGNPPTIMAINYSNTSIFPQDILQTIRNGRQIAASDAWITSLKLTPQQVENLKKLRPAIHMATQPADEEQLKSLWVEYQAAGDKNAASAKLVQALSAIAHSSLDRTRQVAADRAAKIKAVLTDDQWKQFEAAAH